MKKILFYLFPILFTLALRHAAQAQCTTNAGSIQSWQAVVCGEGDAGYVLNNDAVLDGNDVRVLVAFIGPDPVSGTVLGTSTTGSLPYNPLFLINSPIQIVPVAGNNDGSGNVDWSDPCLSIGPSRTITYRPLPDAAVFPPGGNLSCANNVVNLSAFSTVPGATYAFIGPNGWFSSGPFVPVTFPGLWCALVTDPFGCQNQACALITTDAAPPVISAGVPDQISCANPSVTLIAGVVSPPTGYVVLWQGPGGFSSAQLAPQVNVPGVYTFTAIDTATQCYSTATEVVSTENPVGVVASPTVCGQDTLTIGILPPPGFQLPITYMWNTGSTDNELIVTSPPTSDFCVTLTDATGCQSVICLSPTDIAFPAPLGLTLFHEVISCNSEYLVANASGGVQPYLYIWSFNGVPQGSGNGGILADQSGVYSLTVIDAVGCSITADTFLEVQPDLCAQIRGRVFRDNNEDCVFTASEPGLAGWFVQATDGITTYYGTTDSAGYYHIPTYPGSFVVSVQIPNTNVWTPCANPLNTGLLASADTATLDFPIKALVDCPIMSVSLSTPVLRRCFSNNFYYANWCNNGTVTAVNAYQDITLDPLLELINASQPYTDLGNNVFRFQLGDVPPGQCGTLNMQVKVSCDALPGQAHCSEAHIYPDTACAPNPSWSGASVEISGSCDQDSVHFTIKNAGQSAMTVPLEYVVIEDAIMFLVTPVPPLAPDQEVERSFPANGATWRMIANQEPNHPFSPALPTAWVEGCIAGGGSFSTGFVQMFPDGDGVPWLDVDCTANVGSYDPNDKQGAPIGYGAAHYVKPGTPLEYLIRFQNTGSDTAFTVVVRDTLSPWLDVTSIQPGASSHPYRMELYGEGIVQFTFDNILLPDSSLNEAASHGFVKFGINPRANTPLETDIFNQAAIYFDFNAPVLTNTTWHRIGENFALLSWQPLRPELDLRIAPHPMGEEARIDIGGLPTGRTLTVAISDLNGRQVRTETVVSPSFVLHRNGLLPGMYFLEIRDQNGLAGRAKLMVK